MSFLQVNSFLAKIEDYGNNPAEGFV